MALNCSHPKMPGFIVTKVSPHHPPPSVANTSAGWTIRDMASLSSGPYASPHVSMGYNGSCCQDLQGPSINETRTWSSNEDHALWAANHGDCPFTDPNLPGISADKCRHRLRYLESKVRRNTHRNFERFGDLPTELRLKIWKLAGHKQARIVEVHPVQLDIEYLLQNPNIGVLEKHSGAVTHFRSKTLLPTLMHVCRESRTTTFEIYRPLILSNDFIPDSVCFDHKLDTMYLTHEALDTWISSRGRTFYMFPPFQRAKEVDDEANPPLNYSTARTSCFPPRSPAGRAVMNLRSLAIDFYWMTHPIHNHSSRPLIHLDLGRINNHWSNSNTLLSNFFYLSDLEELVILFDKSYRYQPRDTAGSLINKELGGVNDEVMGWVK